MPIHEVKADLKRIIRLVHRTLKIDAAIFDPRARIVACTDEYLRQKGKAVHAPPIEDVIARDRVVVNTPGHMPTCRGCRFIGNCPAKIELLKSIRTDQDLFGVLTFTSFTDAGHRRISQETDRFIEALTAYCDWITQLVSSRKQAAALHESRQVLKQFMALSGESILVLDEKGDVAQCNTRAENLFSFCDLYTRSAYHILPDAVVEKALDGHILDQIPVMINTRQAVLSSRPVATDSRLKYCLVSIVELSDAGDRPGQSRPRGDKTDYHETPHYLSGILGDSPGMTRIKSTVQTIRTSHSTVLISGETGTGKGLLAKAIHLSSLRADGPFVPLNCTSIPETLFESELFGYEEGAFTGAKKGGKPGRLELARGGTLFLDEIGEMPLHMQVKLLNVLQDNEFQRVGGVVPVVMDTRIIAATNQNLDTLVQEKKFRADLFYRLNVIPIHLPPLRDRHGDIDLMIRTFLSQANQKTGRQIQGVSGPVMQIFRSHTWPGNIRQLQNIIEYCVNLEPSDTISLSSLPEQFLARTGPVNISGRTAADPKLRATVIHTEAQAILDGLEQFGHDLKGKEKTARSLGISLRTLYRKLEKINQTA